MNCWMILWIFLLFIFEQKICSLLFDTKICKWNQSFQKSFVTNLTFMNERSLMTSKSTLLKWMKCIIVLGYADYRHIGLHQSLLYNYSEQYTFNISRSLLQISNRKKYENFENTNNWSFTMTRSYRLGHRLGPGLARKVWFNS